MLEGASPGDYAGTRAMSTSQLARRGAPPSGVQIDRRHAVVACPAVTPGGCRSARSRHHSRYRAHPRPSGRRDERLQALLRLAVDGAIPRWRAETGAKRTRPRRASASACVPRLLKEGRRRAFGPSCRAVAPVIGAMTNGLWDQGPERRETRGNAMGRFVAGGRPIETRMWGPNGGLVEILTKLVK